MKRKIETEAIKEEEPLLDSDTEGTSEESHAEEERDGDPEEAQETDPVEELEPLVESFAQLQVDKWLIQSLKAVSISRPTRIQQACIPPILSGKDVIASAKTGSGKTAAFALPILQNLAKDPFGIYALVLTPTRELAFQIAEQFRVLGTGIHLKYSVIVGGLDMLTQAVELSKKPHIVIATPGRLVDHIHSSTGAVDLKRIKYLASKRVLDEADRLLDDSFADDLEVILDSVSKKRQTLLFSATMTADIEALQFSPSSKPFVFRGNTRFDTVEKLDQRYLFVPSAVKDLNLLYVLRHTMQTDPEKQDDHAEQIKSQLRNKRAKMDEDAIQDSANVVPSRKSVIVFVNKKNLCERVYLMLRELDVRCTALHSKMSQNERLGSIAKFKSGIVPVLVTTDVGSRGLDIPSVELVVHYDLPADPADYIHRVGRTARAGRGGMSLAIVSERDVNVLLHIEKVTKKKLVEYQDAPEQLVLPLMNEVTLARKKTLMKMNNKEP